VAARQEQRILPPVARTVGGEGWVGRRPFPPPPPRAAVIVRAVAHEYFRCTGRQQRSGRPRLVVYVYRPYPLSHAYGSAHGSAAYMYTMS
jgi:hypothetical protein